MSALIAAATADRTPVTALPKRCPATGRLRLCSCGACAQPRRSRLPSSCSCRSGRGTSSRPRRWWHGSRRTGRDSPSVPPARPRTSRTPSVPDALGVSLNLGEGDARVGEPRIEILEALELEARREEVLAHDAHLVLDLTLLPSRRRRASRRLNQMMAHQLLEAAIEPAVLADVDRINRRLHVVVDAAPARALEEGERLLVRVEHHLLALTR